MSVKVKEGIRFVHERKLKKIFLLLSLILITYIFLIQYKDSNFFLIWIFSFGISLFSVYFLKNLKLEFLDDKISKNHAVHMSSVPRLGGLGIVLSVFLASVIFFNSDKTIISLVIAGIIVFLIGFFEDIIQNIPPIVRLTIMLVPVLYIVLILNGVVLDIYYFKLFFPVAFFITVLGVLGVINAINIIDGLNGLASGVSLITFLIFFLSVADYNESLKVISIIFFYATFGFFIINIFTGKIFLGDGGSYLLGFSLAEISILISNNTELSPWFPVALLMYPIWEVLFSMFRRKAKGKGMMYPDKLHMHTLIYIRVFKKIFKDPVKANSFSSLFILSVLALLDTIVFMYRHNVDFLVIYIVLFAIFYLFVYKTIINFKFGKIFANFIKLREKKEKQILKPVGEIKS